MSNNTARIEIKDIFRDYKGKESGLDKQARFLFARQSMPLHCPACQKRHSVNELHVSHPDYKADSKANQHFSVFVCPATKAKLKHDILLIGTGDFLNLLPTFYYEWGTEPTGMVSTGVYINDVYHSTGLIEKSKALADNLEFHNPHS